MKSFLDNDTLLSHQVPFIPPSKNKKKQQQQQQQQTNKKEQIQK